MSDEERTAFLKRWREQAEIVKKTNDAFVTHMKSKYANKSLTYNTDKSFLDITDPVYQELMIDLTEYECRFHIPGYATTMDYCIFRFNVIVGAGGEIEEMYFG